MTGPLGEVRAVLGLGSNLGDRLDILQGAVQALIDAPGIDVVAISPVYETEPVGGPAGQPPYLNAVIIVSTRLAAATLLERCHSVEDTFDRIRAERWGPRTLDIDLISYDEQVSGSAALTLPHPRAHERAFVLAPWYDVDPAAQVLGRGSVADLLTTVDRSGIRRLPDTLELP